MGFPALIDFFLKLKTNFWELRNFKISKIIKNLILYLEV